MGSTQPYHDPSFLKEVWGLFGVGCLIYFLRFLVRIRAVGIKGFQGDDYIAIAVLACYTVDAITVDLCYHYGTNVDFTPERLANMSQADQDKVVFGSRMQLLAWYTYTGLVWGLKAQMLFFFNRLTFGLRQQQLVKWLAVACGVTYLAVFLTITFACFPTQRNWQVVPYPGLKCTFKPQNFYVSTVLNVITDAAILCIPLPLMWALQVSLKKKIALMLLLSSGVFVITAAIIRIVMTLVASPSALTINSWGVRETIAGIFAVNLPIIRPIFTKCFWTRNFPPSSQKDSSARSGAPQRTSDATGNGRSGLRNAFSRRVDAYELEEDFPPHSHSHRSQHLQSRLENEKKFDAQTDVAELDSASASDHQPTTNRSSEDLVVQKPPPLSTSMSVAGSRRPSASRRPSSPSSLERERDMDIELGAQSPPRVEVLVDTAVEQRYHSSREARSASWREEQPWSGAWPNRGYGNRTTIEARKGSRAS